MTATNGTGPELIQVLMRADRRWADKRADEPAPPDYLQHLEQYLRPLVGAAGEVSNGDAQPSIPDADTANLRAQRDRARSEVQRLEQANQELTKELGRMRTDYAESVRGSAELADQVEQLRREREQLANQLHSERKHECAWEWPDPDGPLLPCACGRPWPRYATQDETEEVEPEVEPWAELLDRVRGELQEIDWPVRPREAG